MNRFGAIIARQALTAQLALVGLAMACAAFWPPSQGRMLLVPLGPGAVHMLARAVDGGAQLLGSGPLPGSFVVAGNRLALAAALGNAPVLILAAPPALCGSIAA